MSHSADKSFAVPPWMQKDIFVRQFIEQAWDLFCIFDVHRNLTYASKSFNPVIGFIPEDFLQVVELIDSEYRMDLHKMFIRTVQTCCSSKLEFRMKGTGESYNWFECTSMPIRDAAGELAEICFVLNDITLRKNQENRLIAMAFHDPLTGLPNRRLFKEHLHQLLMQAKRMDRYFALVYLDIDDFKLINDTMGHDVGDAFLQHFAQRIQGCLREVDMFARMGGDEFTILLPGVDCEEHVRGVAQRILNCVDQPWEVLDQVFRATVSMGITMYHSDTREASQMLKEVDIALYQVKGKGRNHYQFYQPKSR
ncbi:diguanylate cyclase domain-containing protein [Paenibacillus sp. GCM10023248]|uniref:sensor domain-containing diguanylate cyclase n=1 Tax=Bacillales TaxID=1385 RepID=UPI002377F62F|nr:MULTISPECIES: sensor domain-containing diguanylate cyclase [Bacillales]MDD9271044.1 sensor domain-containing diguanylate cyclase [Paenibacillus sp. MAHUQ-63]MDR6882818.1 diguanylate cyclase (GGDEF)-like protein/PAS domain S-box-containing protein [Bacillus sp. 3255]